MVVAQGVPGEVLFAYNEKLFGDMASADEIRNVFERISDNATSGEETYVRRWCGCGSLECVVGVRRWCVSRRATCS